MIVRMASVLRRARAEIKRDRALVVECHCLFDKRGRARLDTLDEAARPEVRRKESIIAAINRALE
jgi:hypothetical protein